MFSRASSIIQSRRGRKAFPVLDSALGKKPDNPATDPDLRQQLNKLYNKGEKFSFKGTDGIMYTYQWTAKALSATKTCQGCAFGCKPGKSCGVVLDGQRIWQDVPAGQKHHFGFQVKTSGAPLKECTKKVVEWALETKWGLMPPEIGITRKSDWKKNWNCHIPEKKKCARWIYGQGEGLWGLKGWANAVLIGAKGAPGEFITWVARRILQC